MLRVARQVVDGAPSRAMTWEAGSACRRVETRNDNTAAEIAVSRFTDSGY